LRTAIVMVMSTQSVDTNSRSAALLKALLDGPDIHRTLSGILVRHFWKKEKTHKTPQKNKTMKRRKIIKQSKKRMGHDDDKILRSTRFDLNVPKPPATSSSSTSKDLKSVVLTGRSFFTLVQKHQLLMEMLTNTRFLKCTARIVPLPPSIR